MQSGCVQIKNSTQKGAREGREGDEGKNNSVPNLR